MSNAMLEIRDSIFNVMDDIDGESKQVQEALTANLKECMQAIVSEKDTKLLQAFIDYIEESSHE